jgi:type II secretory pathway pseudopilin PulG
MVTLVVLAIVLTIAVPTLLGSRERASDVAAKSLAREGLATQKTFFADRGAWGQAADVQPEEPAIRFDDLDLRGPQVLGVVYVKVDGDTATLVARSTTGTCYWVREPARGATTYASTLCADTPTDADFHSSW